MSLLFVTESFVTEVFAQASPQAVLAAASDFPAYIRLNPLVVSVDPLPGEVDAYLVVDRLRWLGVSFSLRYEVRFQHVEGGIDADVRASPATKLHNELRVTPEGEGARVIEVARMTAPRPFVRYALRAAQAAHRDLLDRLKQRAEGGA